MNRLFENVGNDNSLEMPKRATVGSAGYDVRASEDIVIPSYINNLLVALMETPEEMVSPRSLEDTMKFNKKSGLAATLIPTDIAAKVGPDEYVDIRPRSGVGTKGLLLMPHSMGLIDQDFYPSGMMVGVINLSPFPIQIKKGDRIAQAVIHKYLTVDNDDAEGERNGQGVNSTGTR